MLAVHLKVPFQTYPSIFFFIMNDKSIKYGTCYSKIDLSFIKILGHKIQYNHNGRMSKGIIIFQYFLTHLSWLWGLWCEQSNIYKPLFNNHIWAGNPHKISLYFHYPWKFQPFPFISLFSIHYIWGIYTTVSSF